MQIGYNNWDKRDEMEEPERPQRDVRGTEEDEHDALVVELQKLAATLYWDEHGKGGQPEAWSPEKEARMLDIYTKRAWKRYEKKRKQWIMERQDPIVSLWD